MRIVGPFQSRGDQVSRKSASEDDIERHTFVVTLNVSLTEREWRASPYPTIGDTPTPRHVKRWVEDHFIHGDSHSIVVQSVTKPETPLPPPKGRSHLARGEVAAKYCGYSITTLYRWEKEGRITRHSHDGRTYWDLGELPRATREIPRPNPPRVKPQFNARRNES